MLSGISKEEALIALALFESAMEGNEMAYSMIPFFIGGEFDTSLTIEQMFLGYTPHVIFKLKFLTLGILWYALTSNKVGSKRVLNWWYWIGIILDFLLVAILFTKLLILFGLVGPLWGSTYWIVRLLFWIAATLVLRAFSEEDEPGIFESGGICQSGNFVKSFLVWEFSWYTIVVIGALLSSLASYFYERRLVLLQMADIRHWYTTLILAFLSISSLVTLVGILRGCKFFMKFWFFAYLIVGTVLYAGTNILEVADMFSDISGNVFWQILVSGVPLLVLILRAVALVRIFSFAYKSHGETIRSNDDEKQSLLVSQFQMPTE